MGIPLCVVRVRVQGSGFRVEGLGFRLNQHPPTTLCKTVHTQRLHSSSFLGRPYRILNMNPKKELLWSLRVPTFKDQKGSIKGHLEGPGRLTVRCLYLNPENEASSRRFSLGKPKEMYVYLTKT